MVLPKNPQYFQRVTLWLTKSPSINMHDVIGFGYFLYHFNWPVVLILWSLWKEVLRFWKADTEKKNNDRSWGNLFDADSLFKLMYFPFHSILCAFIRPLCNVDANTNFTHSHNAFRRRYGLRIVEDILRQRGACQLNIAQLRYQRMSFPSQPFCL